MRMKWTKTGDPVLPSPVLREVQWIHICLVSNEYLLLGEYWSSFPAKCLESSIRPDMNLALRF